MSSPESAKSLGGSNRIDIGLTGSTGGESQIERGRQLSMEETPDASPPEITADTREPLQAEEDVRAYQEGKTEDKSTKFSQRKPNTTRESITHALGIGGKVVAKGGIVLGLLMGPPGIPFFLLGIGSLILGHKLIVHVESQKKEKAEVLNKEVSNIRNAIEPLPDEVKKRIEDDLSQGKKSIQQIKFETLKEIIQSDSSIADNIKSRMLSQFENKKGSRTEYSQLMDRYIIERERSGGEDSAYFLDLLGKLGTDRQKEMAIEGFKQNKDDDAIWQELKEEGIGELQSTCQSNVLGRLLGFRG